MEQDSRTDCTQDMGCGVCTQLREQPGCQNGGRGHHQHLSLIMIFYHFLAPFSSYSPVQNFHFYLLLPYVFQVFNCPGCSEFTVDFDPRCETERRFEFLVYLFEKVSAFFCKLWSTCSLVYGIIKGLDC